MQRQMEKGISTRGKMNREDSKSELWLERLCEQALCAKFGSATWLWASSEPDMA
jgi:hypothetical protein